MADESQPQDLVPIFLEGAHEGENPEMDIPRDVAMKITTIKNMLEDCPDLKERIPIPNNVQGRKVMELVVELCKVVVSDPEKAKEAYTKEVAQVYERLRVLPIEELGAFILSVNFLEVKLLLEQSTRAMAQVHIKGKTPEEIRRIFNIKNDFTPEEEDQIRRENAWCEEAA